MKSKKHKFPKILFLIFLGIGISSWSYGQEAQQLIGQMAKIYTGTDQASSGLIGGFSTWGLIGGFLFGSIGFIAFMYGKKNTAYIPALIGIALMSYPYFVRGTIALYLAGTGLTAGLYFFRE